MLLFTDYRFIVRKGPSRVRIAVRLAVRLACGVGGNVPVICSVVAWDGLTSGRCAPACSADTDTITAASNATAHFMLQAFEERSAVGKPGGGEFTVNCRVFATAHRGAGERR